MKLLNFCRIIHAMRIRDVENFRNLLVYRAVNGISEFSYYVALLELTIFSYDRLRFCTVICKCLSYKLSDLICQHLSCASMIGIWPSQVCINYEKSTFIARRQVHRKRSARYCRWAVCRMGRFMRLHGLGFPEVRMIA